MENIHLAAQMNIGHRNDMSSIMSSMHLPLHLPNENEEDSEVEMLSRPATPASYTYPPVTYPIVDENSGELTSPRSLESPTTNPARIATAPEGTLWDPNIGVLREHPPPPEQVYNSFDEACNAVKNWGFQHGVSYAQSKWNRQKSRLCMACNRYKSPTRAKSTRPGAKSERVNCSMRFWLNALDEATAPNCRWVVKHCKHRMSVLHNHPPNKDVTTFPAYRRGTRSPAMLAKLREIWPYCKGPKQAAMLMKVEYPESVWTRQDIRNEFAKFKQQELEIKTKTEQLLQRLEQENFDPFADEQPRQSSPPASEPPPPA